MTYSRFKSMRVKNFRNIGDINIDFTESPIVVLTGDNEAGKTSVIKAFAVAGLHAYPKEQADYIRDGTNGFGIAFELENNSVITRFKTETTNMYTVDIPGKPRWSTPKIDAGLPVEVSQLMGLIHEPETKEYLQVRTYEDSLLFVVTSPGTNYKVMYDALKVDQITKAIKMGSDRANVLKDGLNKADYSAKTLVNEIKKIRIYDIEPVVNIRTRIKNEVGQVVKLGKAISLLTRIKDIQASLGALALIKQYGVNEIDPVEATRLKSINNILKNQSVINKSLSKIVNVRALNFVDMTTVNKIKSFIVKKNRLTEITEKNLPYEKIKNVAGIDITPIVIMTKAIARMKRTAEIEKEIGRINLVNAQSITDKNVNQLRTCTSIISIRNRINQLGGDLKECTQKVEEYAHLIKETGAIVADCPRCGESVIVDARAY